MFKHGFYWYFQEFVVFGLGLIGGYKWFKCAARVEPKKVCFMAPNVNAQMHVLREETCDHSHCSYKGLQWILDHVDRAEKSIDIMMYFLTYAAFTNALMRAKERGVRIRLILQFDKSDEGSEWVKLRRQHISIRMMDLPASQLQHIKMLIFDRKYMLTGSMNFTFSGLTENEEEMLVIDERRPVRLGQNYYNRIWDIISDHDQFLTECRIGWSKKERLPDSAIMDPEDLSFLMSE